MCGKGFLIFITMTKKNLAKTLSRVKGLLGLSFTWSGASLFLGHGEVDYDGKTWRSKLDHLTWPESRESMGREKGTSFQGVVHNTALPPRIHSLILFCDSVSKGAHRIGHRSHHSVTFNDAAHQVGTKPSTQEV